MCPGKIAPNIWSVRIYPSRPVWGDFFFANEYWWLRAMAHSQPLDATALWKIENCLFIALIFSLLCSLVYYFFFSFFLFYYLHACFAPLSKTLILLTFTKGICYTAVYILLLIKDTLHKQVILFTFHFLWFAGEW